MNICVEDTPLVKRDEIQGEWRPQAGGGNFSETQSVMREVKIRNLIVEIGNFLSMTFF